MVDQFLKIQYRAGFKRLFFLFTFLAFTFSLYGQTVTICSWNVRNFGKTKTDEHFAIMSKILKNVDVVAIQEVVSGYGGTQAVARLAEELNTTGTKWDYTVSLPTISSAYKTERYAFLWKTDKIKKVGESWLEQKFRLVIEREPFYSRFKVDNNEFTLVNFHAITKSKQPETEIKYFKFLPVSYPKENLIFCGDFNLPQSHTVFNPLKKMGYAAALINQKTSLKQKCNWGDCLASEYDNFFYRADKFAFLEAGIIPFYEKFEHFSDAKILSDHVPVYLKLEFKQMEDDKKQLSKIVF